MGTPRLRRGTADDAAALEHLERALYTSDIEFAEDWLEYLKDPKREVWVLEDDDGFAGSLLLVDARTSLRIEGISLARRAQGKGWSRKLIEHAEGRARARGKTRLALEVRPDNERALKVYEGAGFKRVGTTPDFYEDGATAIRMARPLT